MVKRTRYSKVSIEWLDILAKELDIFIRHARNRGEKVLRPTRYKADGYSRKYKLVFEFHGSKTHGNPYIYKHNDSLRYFRKKRTAFQLYEKTKQREEELLKLGYSLIVIWEHQYRDKNKFDLWLHGLKALFAPWEYRSRFNPFIYSSTNSLSKIYWGDISKLTNGIKNVEKKLGRVTKKRRKKIHSL